MGKLRKLRRRLLTSIGAVRRSVFRRPSQTTLPAPSNAMQLHWNEARRIYSEPMPALETLSDGEADSVPSSITTAVTDCRSLSCGAVPSRRKRYNNENLCTVSAAGGSYDDTAQLSENEEDLYDDVFLQSWEEQTVYKRCGREDFLLGHETVADFSEASSGYSTLSNANLLSPTLYLPPPGDSGGSSGDGVHDSREEVGVCEGGISGWDDWRIAEHEVMLGPIISSTEREIIYSGYWHGNVRVHSRKVREVEDLICFLKEVTTLCCIRHENIQLFMGACLSMQKGSLAIIMGEARGNSLHSRLHHLGHSFTNSSKIKILRQIAEGMEYLHGRGIPHGLLSTHCISLHYRVCISLAPHYSHSSARQLEPREFPYLPPEFVRELRVSWCRSRDAVLCGYGKVLNSGGYEGEGKVEGLNSAPWVSCERRVCMIQLKKQPTLPADLFAFGTVIYELVMLEYPYKSLPLQSQIWKVGKADLQTLALLPKGQLKNIIKHCWKEMPQARPTFKDLLTTIEQQAISPCTSHSPLRPSHSLPCIASTTSSSSSSSISITNAPPSNYSKDLS